LQVVFIGTVPSRAKTRFSSEGVWMSRLMRHRQFFPSPVTFHHHTGAQCDAFQ
jgi:hypothetical protein